MVDESDAGSFLTSNTRVPKVLFAVAVIKFFSLIFLVASFLMLLHLWVTVVHNELFFSRSKLNIKIFVGALFVVLVLGLFGNCAYFFWANTEEMVQGYAVELQGIAAELALLCTQAATCVALISYYCVGFVFLRSNPNPAIQKRLILQLVVVVLALLLAITAIVFLTFSYEKSPIELNQWAQVFLRFTLFMCFNTLAILSLILISWSSSKKVSTTVSDEPLLAKSGENASEDDYVPMQYRI